jgi:hypothetical protein
MRLRHAEVPIPKADAFRQLAAEKDWLRGETAGSFLARVSPSRRMIDIAQRVEKVLAHRDLGRFLGELEKHNGDRSTPFLLAPHLYHSLVRSKRERPLVKRCRS